MKKPVRKTVSKREEALAEIRHATMHRARVTAAFREIIARQAGMTVSDMLCIEFLLECGSATAGDLAEVTGLTSGAISGLITRLERFGQITSERSSSDKRQVIIKPVPAKMKWYTDAVGSVTREILDLQGSYSVQEIKTIGTYSHQVANILQRKINKLLKKDGNFKHCICCRGKDCCECC